MYYLTSEGGDRQGEEVGVKRRNGVKGEMKTEDRMQRK